MFNDILINHKGNLLSADDYKAIIINKKYPKTNQNTVDSPLKMNVDARFSILLNTNIEAMSSICSVDANLSEICNRYDFWVKKFKHDKLPFILKKIPTTLNKWVIEYKKIENAYDFTSKLVNYILNGKKNYLHNFKMEIGIENDDWTKLDWFKINSADDESENPYDRFFVVDLKNFNIGYMYVGEENYYPIIGPLSKPKFKLCLTQIFYYYPDTALDGGNKNRPLTEDPTILYQELLHNPIKAKIFLPEW